MRAQNASAAALRPATVLVVEDEPLIRMDLAEELRSAGYNVVEARNADEALAVLEAGVGADVLLTDVKMPGSRDGLALARIVHQQFADTRIVVVSAQHPDWEPGLVDASFRKPFSMPQLLAALAAMLASAECGG